MTMTFKEVGAGAVYPNISIVIQGFVRMILDGLFVNVILYFVYVCCREIPMSIRITLLE